MKFYIKDYNLVHDSQKVTLWNADLFRLIKVRLTLPSKKHWQYCNLSYMQQNFQFTPNKDMLVTVSQVIKTFNGVCSYRLKLFKMSPLPLDASTKMAAPLLHCSINDTLINRILHCQNMFTKLTTVLDLTFVPVIILCCEIYSRFCVPKIIIIIITFITCKLP